MSRRHERGDKGLVGRGGIVAVADVVDGTSLMLRPAKWVLESGGSWIIIKRGRWVNCVYAKIGFVPVLHLFEMFVWAPMMGFCCSGVNIEIRGGSTTFCIHNNDKIRVNIT